MKTFIYLVLALTFTTLNAQEWQEDYKKANQLLYKRDFQNALITAQSAYDRVTELYGENTTYQATQLGLIGRIHYLSGDYINAIDVFEKEKQIRIDNNKTSSKAYASCINNLSVCYSAVGRQSEIEQLLLEATEIKKRVSGDMDTSYAKTLNNLGQYYQSQGRYPEAERILIQALEIKETVSGENNYSTGMTYYNVGMLYQAIGNNEKSKEFFLKAFKVIKANSSENDPNLANIAFELSNIFLTEGNNSESEKYMSLAKKSTTDLQTNFSVEKARSTYNLSKIQIKMGKNKEAEVLLMNLLEPVKLKLGLGHPLYSKIIKALGIVLWINGSLEAAYPYIAESAYLSEQIYGTSNIEYANAILTLAGLLKEMENYDEADEKYIQGFDIYLSLINKYFPYYSESEKTKFYQLIKEQFDKFNSYVLSRNLENPSLIGNMYNLHIATKGILLDYSKNLVDIIERSNDEQLINDFDLWKSKKEQLAKLYNEPQAKLAKMNLNIDSLEKFTNQLEKKISERSQDFGANLDTQVPGWEQIKNTLAPDEAAIEFIRFKFFGNGWKDSTFYAALIVKSTTVDHPELILLKDGKKMDGSALKVYKKTIKTKFPDKRSYKVYWEEIDKKLDGINRVYVSADGVYNIINPACLLKPDKSYVGDNIDIVNINNTKVLVNRQTRSSEKNTSASLFGFPKYEIEQDLKLTDEELEKVKENEIKIAPLPGTQKEIEEITSLLTSNNWQYSKFMEAEASENNFKTVKSPGILHIATHGYFLSDLSEIDGDRVFGVEREKAVQNPLLRAGLLLSGASNFLNYDFTSYDNDENGILTAYEVKNLDLRGTDLVIMSACETGLGKIMNGEGVYGLQRAFQVAGVDAIIMSLWTVDDKTTQELMVAFYSNYLGGMDLTTAFNEARKEIKEKYEKPYYWGAFKLLGGI